MKLLDGGFLIMVSVLVCATLLSVAATSYFDLEDDNVVEELVEELIENKTGLDLDLSPSSPE